MREVPELTTEQRRENLKKAMAARVQRGQLKREIKQGKYTLEQLFDMPEAQKMPVRQLLESLPHIWKAKARKLMQQCGISESRRVRGLGVRQKAKLTQAVNELYSR